MGNLGGAIIRFREIRLPGAELIGIYRRLSEIIGWKKRNAPLRRGALIKERAVGLVLVVMMVLVRAAVMIFAGVLSVFKLQRRVGDIMLL